MSFWGTVWGRDPQDALIDELRASLAQWRKHSAWLRVGTDKMSTLQMTDYRNALAEVSAAEERIFARLQSLVEGSGDAGEGLPTGPYRKDAR